MWVVKTESLRVWFGCLIVGSALVCSLHKYRQCDRAKSVMEISSLRHFVVDLGHFVGGRAESAARREAP